MMTPVDYRVYRGGKLQLTSGKAYTYLMAGNGIFKYAESRHLAACVPVATGTVAGLPYLSPFAALRVPRLPLRVLQNVLVDARMKAQAKPIEQMYHAMADGRVVIPEQEATAAHLSYKGGDHPGILLDLHSHCEMRACFSSTDNRDEQGFRLYGVIGTIFTCPNIVLRVGVYGDFWPVPLATVFEVGAR